MTAAELILSATIAIFCCPALDSDYWWRHPDNLAPAIALLLEVAGIACLVHGLALLLT